MEVLWCNKAGCGVQLENIGGDTWKCNNCGDIHSFEDDDDDGEAISVWDAADIYLSKGFDEDYQFGYSHDELMRALGQ